MAQVEYIRLDTDFFDKPKIKALRRRHGNKGILLVLRILTSMGKSTDGALVRDTWEVLAEESDYKEGEAEAAIAYCLAVGIFSGDEENLSNRRVTEDQEALERKRASKREEMRRYRGREKGTSASVVKSFEDTDDLNRIQPRAVSVVEPPMQRETVDPGNDETLKIALTKLETPADQQWTLDNRFISAGRRPMKDYQNIWLTPFELADVMKKLQSSDIPQGSYKDLFLKAEAKLVTWKQERRSLTTVSVYNWLTGFLFDELLERAIKERRLAKTIEAPKQFEGRR